MKYIYKFTLGLVAILPVFAFADAANPNLKDLASTLVQYLNIGVSLILALAFIVFVWNVFKYFFVESDRAQAGMYVMYSVIGFFVIFSFWGLVNLLKNSIPLNNTKPPELNINGLGGGRSNTSAPVN